MCTLTVRYKGIVIKLIIGAETGFRVIGYRV